MSKQARWIFVSAGPSIIDRRSPEIKERIAALFPDKYMLFDRLEQNDERVAALIDDIVFEVWELAKDIPFTQDGLLNNNTPQFEILKRRSCLELFSLLNLRVTDKDRLYIIAYDSIVDHLNALAFYKICKSILGWTRTELVPVIGYQGSDYERFRTQGIGNFAKQIDKKSKNAPQNAEVILDMTGCMRLMLPLATILGVLNRMIVVDLDETSGVDRIIPPLPFEFSRRWFGNPYYQVLEAAFQGKRRFSKGQLIQKGVAELIPLFEEDGRTLKLSIIGQLIFEVIRIKNRKDDWRERY